MDDQSLSPAPSSVTNEDLDEPVEGCTSSPVPQEHRVEGCAFSSPVPLEHRVEGRAFSSPVPKEHRVEGRVFSSPVPQEHRIEGRAFFSPVPQEHRIDGRAFSSPVPQEHWVVPGPSRRLSVIPKAVCYSLFCALWKQLTPQVVCDSPHV